MFLVHKNHIGSILHVPPDALLQKGWDLEAESLQATSHKSFLTDIEEEQPMCCLSFRLNANRNTKMYL